MFIILQLFPYKILSHVTWVVCLEQITVMVSSVVGNWTFVSCKIWSTCQWLPRNDFWQVKSLPFIKSPEI